MPWRRQQSSTSFVRRPATAEDRRRDTDRRDHEEQHRREIDEMRRTLRRAEDELRHQIQNQHP